MPLLMIPQGIRCLDNAGISAYNKAELVKLAPGVVKMLRDGGLANRDIAFRVPSTDRSSFEDKQKKILPDLPPPETWVKNWEVLRDFLPEISKSVILSFLRQVNPSVTQDSRVWYRGMQRVMDMGNLNRLWATRPSDGIMWIGFR